MDRFLDMLAQSAINVRPVCLIAEDEPLIGMEIEAHLYDLGCQTGELFSSAAEALSWLQVNTPQLAVLDFILKDGPSTTVGRELKKRGVPFIIYSGNRRDRTTPAEFDDVPWIEKPAELTDVLNALAAAAMSRSGKGPEASPDR